MGKWSFGYILIRIPKNCDMQGILSLPSINLPPYAPVFENGQQSVSGKTFA